MSYTELKKRFDNTRREQLQCDKKIRNIKEELKKLDDETKSVMAALETKIVDDRAKALKTFREEHTKPIEEKITAKKVELETVQVKYNEQKGAINFDNIMAECSDRQDILKEVKEASQILKKQLVSLLGERFYKALCNRLEEVDLEEKNLDALIYYFNQSQKTLEAFESHNSSVSLKDLEEALRSVKVLKVVVAIVVLASIILFGRVILPVFSLVAVLLSVYTIAKHYQVCRILMIQKAVQDNVDAIEEHLKQQAMEEVKLRQQQLSDRFVPKITYLENEISLLEKELFECNARVDNTFKYDESRMNDLRDAELKKIDEHRSNLLVNESTYKKLLDEQTQIIAELGQQISDILGGLSKQYLSGVGTEVVFEPKFLLDVDTEKSKPVMFKHPQKSTLFLYDSLEEVYNFIRLLCVELRAKLNPFSLNIVAVDELNACQDLVYFGSSTSEKTAADVSSLFKMVVNEEDIHKYIEQLASNLFRKQSNIRREFDNIEVYNKRMLELESLTEAYDFHFIVEPGNMLLQHPDFQRSLRIGDSMGIFLHTFISKKNFSRMKDSAMELLDVVGKVYYMEEDGCHDRAKDFIVEDLLS